MTASGLTEAELDALAAIFAEAALEQLIAEAEAEAAAPVVQEASAA